jgi:2-keto-4-pentenoate hydratase/2-oxohepta-3-ene-1,7-dioic acid hydratase in catechol pathway
MPLWVRFAHGDQTGFGTLSGATIQVHEGRMFDAPVATPLTLALDEVKLLIPCVPSKMIALWNNFHALAAKLDVIKPDSPLYLLKGNNSFLAHDETIVRPNSYAGPVAFEGELGIVIGKRCKEVSEDEAADCIFGYTCVNDVTAAAVLKENPTFDQWTRAKSYDTFGVFGPAIATDVDPLQCSVRTILNGAERQNYPLSDMIIPPHRMISQISHDMTLMPGDVICCGTSLGVGSMKEKTNTIEVAIEGIGTLSNIFEN